MRFPADCDEFALCDRLRPRLPLQRRADRGSLAFSTEPSANGALHNARVDQRGLRGWAGSTGLLAAVPAGTELRLFFGAVAEVDLRRCRVERRLAIVVEVAPCRDQDRNGENQPLAPPERSEHSGGLGSLDRE